MKIPQPDMHAIEHSQRLSRLIQAEIQQHLGFISFARFMELALYAPGLGYYSAGTHKFGKGGDFITAPELSPLFAKCLARQCQQVLSTLKTGDILEFGAGSGVLAKDLLLELEQLNSLPTHYFILETSADLRTRQATLLQQHCPHLLSRIIWLDALPSEPITGIILANEVMDALPTHCFQLQDSVLHERCVTWENEHFAWKLTKPTTPELDAAFARIQTECEIENGYGSEINLLHSPWIHSLAHTLKQGLILLLDYGYSTREYYRPDRNQGTLMCYYQHHKHSDPFFAVGLQDITAHVDFTQIAESGLAAGLTLAGYTTQAGFLLGCGLTGIADAADLSETERFQQNQAIKTLTLPSQMGETIKVMGLTKDIMMPFLGFSLYDRRRDL